MKTGPHSPTVRTAALLTGGLAIALLAETALPVDRGGSPGPVVAILPAACNPNQDADCDTMGIDFTREVALVATGAGSDGCHDTSITCVGTGATPEELLVKVTDTVPGTNCACSLAFVTPIDIVKLARPVSTAAFSRTTYQLLCLR